MLLCRVHHKLVDDQAETYTAEILRGIKAKHEQWVEARLGNEGRLPEVRIKRIQSEIPEKLPRITSGKELLAIAVGCHGAYNDYSDDLNTEETEVVGGFIQELTDWVDILDGVEPIERMRVAKSLDERLHDLQARGFLVFAATEDQRIEGGVGGTSTFRVLHLSVRRASDPNVRDYKPAGTT
jgi:hypothetical protein